MRRLDTSDQRCRKPNCWSTLFREWSYYDFDNLSPVSGTWISDGPEESQFFSHCDGWQPERAYRSMRPSIDLVSKSFCRAWALPALAVVLALGSSGAPESLKWKQFISKEGDYVAYYPAGWHTFPPSNAPFINIYNFPFSRSGGGVLPDGGASIAVLSAPKGVVSVEQWIDRNRRHPQDGSKDVLVLHRVGSEAPIHVTQVVTVMIRRDNLKAWIATSRFQEGSSSLD
jgi:hypothetical protein